MANPTMTLIASNTVGSGGVASVTFSSISSTYTDLMLKVSARSNASGTYVDDLILQFNSSTTNYSYTQLYGTGSAVGAGNSNGLAGAYAGTFDSTNATANTFGNSEMYIPNYAGSNYKSISADAVAENNATANFQNLVASLWSNTAAITSITLASLNGGNFIQYSTFYLYGIKNS
jgi:hypothetical protein